MGNTGAALTPHERLREFEKRREHCMRDYDRAYGTVTRLRTAVQTAEAQQEWTVVEELTHTLRKAEGRLARLERG